VRADFFDRPLADATIGPLVAQNAFGLTPMTATELHVAITAPADQVGVRADPALVSRLVADTIDQPGSLPLLQFTLAELFERRRGALITLDAYEELGGLAGSLSRQADELYDAFDVGDRATVRRLFTRLVTPGDGTEDTRRRVLVGDLASVPERVVAAFVNRRLLTTDRDRATREPTIEIAHEVLLRSWPRLRVWLDEDRSWLRELRSLTAATTLWDVGGRDVGDLYRAGRLAVVTDLVGAHPGSLTELEQQFLIESQDHDAEEHREAQRRLEEKTRQNRRLRRSLIGIAAVLVLAIGAGAVALVQRQRATRAQRTAVAQRADADAQRLDADAQRADAESQRVIADEQRELADEQRTAAETAAAAANASATAAATAKTAAQLATLASRSLSSRSSQRDLAALLAVEAWQRSHDADAESALFGTFTFDQGFLGYLRFEQANGIGLIGIPGTRDVLVQGFGAANGPGSDSTRVVDATTGEEIVRLDPLFDGGVAHVNTTVSANGRFAAQWVTPALNGPTPDAPSLAAVFDLATGHVVGSPIEILNYVPSMFGVDDSGSRLAVLSDFAGAVAVYDTATASVVATIAPLAGVEETFEFEDIGTAVYGPDGRLYVGTRGDRLRVYDPVSFSMVEEIVTPVDATAGWVEFSSDGMVLVSRGVSLDPDSGEQLGTLTRIDLPTATVAWHLAGADYGYGECNTFAFRTESDQLFCGDYNGLVRERSLSTGGRTGRVLQNQKGTLTDLSIVPVSDGTMLVAGNTTAPVMSRWRIDGGGPVQRLVASGHQIIGKISPDVLLVGRANGRPSPFDLDYSLWDVTEDTEIPGLPAFAFAFAVGDHVFGWIDVDTVAVYEVSTGHVRVFDVHIDDLPTSVTASRDGEVLLLGFGDGSAVAYEANTGTVIQHFQLPATTDGHVPFVNQAAISDDHTRAYFASGELFAFDVVTGAEVAHNVENLRIGYVTVGPNGVVAAGSWDGAFGLFDAETLNETAALPGGRSGMSIAAFSDDGDVLFASANDGTAHLYDVTSHVRLGDPIDLRIPGGGAVSLSPDGLSAAVALPNRTGVVMWDLDPADWAVAACVIAGRNLTRDEWATYLGDLGTYHATCPQYPSG